MITFDYLTLLAFYRENSKFFDGARIQKIQQSSRRDLILTLRNNNISKKLYININPQFYHMAFMSKQNEISRDIQIPQKPPMFCMLLRKYIENAVISHVSIPAYERIFEFYIETYNELSEKVYLCLAVELMGKYSNIILYNYDTNVIIGCAHNVGEDKTTVRELAGTLPYVYPPKQDKIDILKYEGDINYSKLFDTFLGFSMPMQQRSYGKSLDEIKSMFKLENLLPVISSDKAVYSIFGDVKGNQCDSVNSMIDDYYSYHMEQSNLKVLKSELLSIVKPRLKKAENTLLKLRYRLEKAKGGEKYRIYGDLIMANLYNLKDYVEDIEVVNYTDNTPLRIFLDKTKTLKENANSFYKLYNKAKKTLENTTEYFAKVQQEKDYLEQVKYSINSAETLSELGAVTLEIMPEKTVKKLERHSFEPLNIKIDDCEVYIGKNNRQNDFIVSKLAKDEDLWFHVHNCAGSHVLLKSKNPDDETILKCAHLAKKYSSASESSKVGVIYTFAKNLKKPPHSNLGYVIYKGEKEIVL